MFTYFRVNKAKNADEVTFSDDADRVIKLRSKMKSGACNGRVEDTYWAAGFGNAIPSKSIVFELEKGDRSGWAKVTTLICW